MAQVQKIASLFGIRSQTFRYEAYYKKNTLRLKAWNGSSR